MSTIKVQLSCVISSSGYPFTYLSFQTALQVERDALLAEKSSWATTAPITSDATPVSDDIKRLWDAEKAELIKTRDDALTKLKVCDTGYFVEYFLNPLHCRPQRPRLRRL